VTKERKFTYNVSKEALNTDKRNKLKDLVARTALLKTNMQKTPITIDEDLQELLKESEKELTAILTQLEAIFEPVSQIIEDLLNPKKIEEEVEPEVNVSP
jgi:DNA anti-recombination protein RmuC